MKFLLLVLFWAYIHLLGDVIEAAMSNLADVPCGLSGNGAFRRSGGARVIGGFETPIHDYPFAVSIRKNGAHHCGGAIIGRRHILTAAHCVHSYPEKVWSIVVGESAVDRPPSISPIPVSKINLHPSYKRPGYTHDIAILVVSVDIKWSDKSQPACLPDDDLVVGSDGELAGWGYDNEKKKGGKPSNLLHAVQLPILENEVCQDWFKSQNKPIVIEETHMCAGYEEGGKDGCQGDSGGGLVVREEGKFKLTGVMSAGIGCGRAKLPGMYTRVSSYMDWIRKVVTEV